MCLPEATPQTPRPRIQGLSDLIFGLALSMAAISFTFGGSLPTDPVILTSDLASFGFTFLILINVWNRYTSTTSVMPIETPVMVRVNMLLLFLVAIEPLLFNVLYLRGLSTEVGQEASVYYGLDIGGMNLILAYFTHLLTVEEKKLVPKEMIRRLKFTRNLLLFAAALFFVSDLPIFSSLMFAGSPVRIDIWVISIPIVFLPRILSSRV
jgi:uncharacterized membrane protein